MITPIHKPLEANYSYRNHVLLDMCVLEEAYAKKGHNLVNLKFHSSSLKFETSSYSTDFSVASAPCAVKCGYLVIHIKIRFVMICSEKSL